MANTLINPFKGLPLAKRQEIWQAPSDPRLRYTPQPYQHAFHQDMWPDCKGVGGGVGGAKTYTIVMDYAHEATAAAIRAHQSGVAADGFAGRIAITGKDYTQPRAAFKYLKLLWDGMGLVESFSMPQKGQWKMVSTTGVEVLTISASDEAAFASFPYTVVHMTEAMQQTEAMFIAANERVSRWPCVDEDENQGMLYCEGTFEDKPENFNWYPHIARTWATPGNPYYGKFYQFASWLNQVNFPGGMQTMADPERPGEVVPDPRRTNKKILRLWETFNDLNKRYLFWERIGGHPPSPRGSLFFDYFNRAAHLTTAAEFDPELPVGIGVDPATHRYAVMFMQWPTPYLCNVVGEIVIPNAAWPEVREAWERSPWAANVRVPDETVAVDVAGTQRHQAMQASTDLWALPADQGGMGLNLTHRWMSLDTSFNLWVRALKGYPFSVQIHPRCLGLTYDLEHAKRAPDGSINETVNKGKDDCYKAVAYYWGQKVGWAIHEPDPWSEEQLMANAGWAPLDRGIHVPQAPRGIFG